MTMTFPPTGGCLPGALRDRLVLIISFMLYFLLDEFMIWHAVSGNGRTAIPLRWDWVGVWRNAGAHALRYPLVVSRSGLECFFLFLLYLHEYATADVFHIK